MPKPAKLTSARKALAEITGALEDATILTSDGQSVLDPVGAGRVVVEAYLRQLNHLRRRLE